MHKTSFIIQILFCCAMTAEAQTDNVVEVANDFRPTVQDATKINTLPEIEQTTVTHYNVDYTSNPFPTTNFAFQPIWAAHNTQLLKPDKKGFVAAGYGMDTNIFGRLAHGFALSAQDQLSFDVATRGYKADVDKLTNRDEQWASRMFNTTIKAIYTHTIDAASDFYINAGYTTDVFNYQPLVATPPVTDKQHNDLIDLNIGVTPYSFGKFGIGANAKLQTFKQKYATTFNEGNSEMQVSATVVPQYLFSENVKADVAIAADYTDYSMKALPGTDKAVEGTFTFDAIPHIYFSDQHVSIKAGVYIDNDVNIAPDVDVTLHIAQNTDVYLQANGGKTNNNFRRFAAMSPYWTLANTSFEMQNQFDQLRARGGVRLNPVKYFSLDLSAGYDISKDRAEIADYLADNTANGLVYAPIVFADGKHFFANANIALNYKNKITANLNTQYNKWDTDLEIAGQNTDPIWRPEFEADWKLSISPIERLTIGADLLFESFKNKDGRYHRASTVNLGATLGYTLPCRLTIFAKGDNLINKKYDQYTMYRSPGINFLAGLALTF